MMPISLHNWPLTFCYWTSSSFHFLVPACALCISQWDFWTQFHLDFQIVYKNWTTLFIRPQVWLESQKKQNCIGTWNLYEWVLIFNHNCKNMQKYCFSQFFQLCSSLVEYLHIKCTDWNVSCNFTSSETPAILPGAWIVECTQF